MDHLTQTLLLVFVVFVSAQVGAEIAQRLKLPAVVGEIAAGVVVGGSVLGWVQVNEPLELLAEIGAVLLLFSVGLETRVEDLRRVGDVALLTGLGGVVLPFVLGAAWALWSGLRRPRRSSSPPLLWRRPPASPPASSRTWACWITRPAASSWAPR